MFKDLSAAWLQVADDAAIISDNCKNAQALLNLFCGWCNWANMCIRVDKCSTFGMSKIRSAHVQTFPNLFVESKQIPTVQQDKSFTYLGKIYSFAMDDEAVKVKLISKLKELLTITSNIKCNVQRKLKILKLYIHSQLLFELKIYNLPLTWIEQNLDAVCIQYIRKWSEQPISSCVAEHAATPKCQGGLGIKSIKSLAQKMNLLARYTLKNSQHDEIQDIWKSTSSNQNVDSDAQLLNCPTLQAAQRSLDNKQSSDAFNYFSSLPYQGINAKAVNLAIPKVNISTWSKCLDHCSSGIHNFAIKALKQVLPTSANLVRWKKQSNASCALCQGSSQTNKHVFSNCSSTVALERYTTRHNAILLILSNWLSEALPKTFTIHVDLPNTLFKPVNKLFGTRRPDIVIMSKDFDILCIELTVCHESNLEQSKQYKKSKYVNLENDCIIKFNRFNIFTVEISTLGFICNTKELTDCLKIPDITESIKLKLIRTALNYSYYIYCNRNYSTDKFCVLD